MNQKMLPFRTCMLVIATTALFTGMSACGNGDNNGNQGSADTMNSMSPAATTPMSSDSGMNNGGSNMNNNMDNTGNMNTTDTMQNSGNSRNMNDSGRTR